MSIVKMEYVNIVGLESSLNDVLLRIIDSGCFHIEPSIKTIPEEGDEFKPLTETNPYSDLLKLLIDLDFGGHFKYKQVGFEELLGKPLSELEDFADSMKKQTNEISSRIRNLEDTIQRRNKELILLKHLQNMNVDLQELFNIKNIRIRFGRLPVDSYPKLGYYSNKHFEFVPYDTDKNYMWGIYFTPVNFVDETDKIFNSLYFERVWIPDFVKGTPHEGSSIIKKMIFDLERSLDEAEKERTDFIKENADMLNKVYCRVTFLYNLFSLRSYASVLKGKFYIVGFVPQKQIKKFTEMFDTLNDVSIVVKPPDSEPAFSTPVQLKNNAFSKPFSMFVEMYGLPSYKGFNPTNLVAITYTLLFGIMFGDLGQGLMLSLIGYLIYSKTKNKLAAIMTRVGFSSAFFGFIFGSVFGFENLLNPVYKSIGLKHKPLDVMENTDNIIIWAICLGIILILISIVLNISIKLKNKNYTEALFNNNGIAGFVFYSALLAALALKAYKHINLFTPAYVICLLILPILLMFFREPLGCLAERKKFHMESGIGDFIATNFFEVFEFLLGYATNTLSFVRIGGFVFSHAGMMSVVMLLADSAAKGASPIVIVIGNIFVMGMEGLIVGIQVLRLEFYEIFSRFYDGDGRSFEPVKVNYDPVIN